jgi:hypothetical protein
VARAIKVVVVAIRVVLLTVIQAVAKKVVDQTKAAGLPRAVIPKAARGTLAVADAVVLKNKCSQKIKRLVIHQPFFYREGYVVISNQFVCAGGILADLLCMYPGTLRSVSEVPAASFISPLIRCSLSRRSFCIP